MLVVCVLRVVVVGISKAKGRLVLLLVIAAAMLMLALLQLPCVRRDGGEGRVLGEGKRTMRWRGLARKRIKLSKDKF